MCQIFSYGFYLFLVTSEMTVLLLSVLFDFSPLYSSLGCRFLPIFPIVFPVVLQIGAFVVLQSV